MKIKKSTSPVLIPLVGLALITGLVHASAQETYIEDVYLRPEISPYTTTGETKIVSLDSGTFVSDNSSYELEAQTTQTVEAEDVSKLQLIDYFAQAISFGLNEIALGDNPKLFTTLKLQLSPSAGDADETTMISNIQVKTNSSSSVTLSWELNKFADVTVYYDTKDVVVADTRTPSVKISAFRFANEATLDGLMADTTYHYLLVVDNHFSKATTMSSGSFRTAP